MRLLLIGDDSRVSRFLERELGRLGFKIDVAPDGRHGFGRAMREAYDAILLDLMLPYMNGFQVLEEVRKHGIEVPVMVISALDAVEDRVRALDLGADDYLVKPFSFDELTARLRALLRRSHNGHPVLKVADLKMDLAARRVERDGRSIELTAKEFALLEYLLRNKGSVVTRMMIAEHVWGMRLGTSSNVIDVYVRYLRSKADEGYGQKLIHTVRGFGYVLSDESA
jgi:DNA-binding response OmpR family regulator